MNSGVSVCKIHQQCLDQVIKDSEMASQMERHLWFTHINERELVAGRHGRYDSRERA